MPRPLTLRLHTPAPPSLPLQPAVTYANVGELAVDVLISSLRPVLVARLESTDVLACVGNDAYSRAQPGTRTTPLELFQLPGAPAWGTCSLVAVAWTGGPTRGCSVDPACLGGRPS